MQKRCFDIGIIIINYIDYYFIYWTDFYFYAKTYSLNVI